MKHNDVLYGEQSIDEPWAIDIINHPVFLRLKGVNQYGYIEPYHPEAQTSRFEHSIGVFLLLRRYELSKEEQLAGLLHDVSHTVFSHCIDYALPVKQSELQKYQDNTHEEYIRKSSISQVIEKHGFAVKDVVSYDKYRALEKELPDLCADRIDYLLRDAISFGVLTKKRSREILENLILQGGDWMFRDVVVAKEFTYLFKKMNNDFYSAPWTGVMFSTVGDYVSYAIKKNYIGEKDFYLTDKEVIKKINQNLDSDQILKDKWLKMNRPDFILDKEDFDVRIKTKSRVVDPWLVAYGEKKRFSEVDEFWRNVVEKEISPKEYFIKYLK